MRRAARTAALLLALLAATPARLPALEPTLPLTLEEAVRLAAERSWDARQAEESRRDLEGFYQEQRAAALPRFTATGYLSRTADAEPMPGAVSRQDSSGVAVQVNQALYSWGRIPAAIRAARLGLDLWRDDREIARRAAVRDATVSFYDLVLAQELARVAEGDLEQRVRHLEAARRRLAAGTATDYDVLAADVAERNAQPPLVAAQSRVRAARERLRFLVGAGEREVQAVGDLAAAAAATAAAPPYEEVLAAARARRPELARLRRRIAVGEEVVTITAAGTKPLLGLSGEAGWRDARLGEEAGGGTYWTAQLALSFPFFDGKATAGRAAQARSRVAALQLEHQRIEDALCLEARVATDALREAEERLRATEGTLALAERLAALAEKGYALGVKTKIEVDDAAQNLSVARAGLARARRDRLAARADLDWVLGPP